MSWYETCLLKQNLLSCPFFDYLTSQSFHDNDNSDNSDNNKPQHDISIMNDLYSTTPSPGNFFTLPLRPAKRARSHYSSQDAENNPKRLRQTSIHDDNETSVPNNKNVSPVNPPPQEQEELTTHTHMINPTPPNPSQINISTLNFPPMLLRKEKRRGLPIHKQFIHPGFFARYLDQQHPDIEFAISDYEEAWYYAVSLASKSVDLSLLAFVSPNVVGRKVEEEVSAACALVSPYSFWLCCMVRCVVMYVY